MTALFDSADPSYLAEKATRDELTRVFDVCGDCRVCVDVCSSFTTLFDLLGPRGEHDAGRLSAAQQDLVVDQCFHCDACVSVCPFAPGRSDAAVDVPKSVIRARAMRRAVGQLSMRERWVAAIVGRPDRVGRLGTRFASVANRLVAARPGSARRRFLRRVTGVTSRRPLPGFARARLSRSMRPLTDPPADVVVHPTCLVEFGDIALGLDLVAAYERSGLTCSFSAAGCCGAASLHAGDLGRFSDTATRTVGTLANELRRHGAVVVAQPGCADTLRRHAVDHVHPDARADAQLVAERIVDPAAPLLGRRPTTPVVAPPAVTVHAQQPDAERAARTLLSDAGAEVGVLTVGIGVTSAWHLRADHDDVVAAASERLDDRVVPPGVVVGSSVLANAVIAARIGREPIDPIAALALGPADPADETSS